MSYVKLDDLFLPNESKPTATVKLLNGSSVSARALTDLSLTSVQGPEAALPKPKSRGKTMNTDGGSGLNDSNNGSFDNSAANENGNAKSSDPYRSGEDWRPHGRVFVNDDIKGEIGVEGIKVRARRWFTTYVGFSDANGYFAVDGWFTRPANYWLDFERYEFSVNDHSGGPKDVDGPKIEGPWYHEFRDYEKFCSTIFRAAYHYYYKDIQGLRRPPENGFWKTQVKIGAFNYRNEDNDGNNSPIRATFGIGELIHIYNPQNRIDEIYATTIHELGHAVHLELTGGFWADTKVCESWARGVQWVLTKMEYPNYIGGTQNNIYTNIIMDMIDDESNNNYYGLRGTKDQVSGYNIIEIQNSLLGVMSWDAWKNKLKNDYENSTEQYLESLFANWANY